MLEAFLRDPASQHEHAWKAALADLAKQPGIFLDLGGGKPFQGYIRPEMLGQQTRYFSLDIRESVSPHIVGDVMQLPFRDESVDSILCNAVLEHVPNPQRAVDEMYRVLKPGGRAYVGVPFIYPYHDDVDYFRFSDSALQRMFERFQDVNVTPVGDYIFVAALFLTGFTFPLAMRLGWLTNPLRAALQLGMALAGSKGRRYQRGLARSPVGWYVYATK
nr:class I SAM-dependent methyltransferase [Ardenticatena sp.]